MRYISINPDGGIAFKDSDINEILETDVNISDDIYNKYFEMQSQGKLFKLKNINGTSFEEIFQEVIPDPVNPVPQEPSELDKLKAENESMKQSIAELTVLVTSMMGGGV